MDAEPCHGRRSTGEFTFDARVCCPDGGLHRSVQLGRPLVHGLHFVTAGRTSEPSFLREGDRDDSHRQTFLTTGTGPLGVDRPLFCEGAGGAEYEEAGDKVSKGQPKRRGSAESKVTTEKTEVPQASKGCARSAADSATVTLLKCGAVPGACSLPTPGKGTKNRGGQRH